MGVLGGRMWKGARARPCPWHPDLGAPGGVTSIRTIGRLLLIANNALKREDDRLGSVNLQFKASSEGQRPPRKHLKGNSFPVVGGTGLNWRQGERNRTGRLNSLARRPSWGHVGGGFLEYARRNWSPQPPPRRSLRGAIVLGPAHQTHRRVRWQRSQPAGAAAHWHGKW